jgi:protein tyrosine/serine phosphatase
MTTWRAQTTGRAGVTGHGARSARPALGSLLRRAGAVIGAAVLALGLSAAGWVGYLFETGNIHTVIPGRLYRSAELSRDGFERVIKHFHIRTVINLRGANPEHSWYQSELAAARITGARHIDLRLSATHAPSAAERDEIRAALADATPPILIHCQSGADRSGLVAALYEYWIAKRPAAQAGAQLSFRYGHFPWLGSRTVAMDEAWRDAVREGQ